MCFNVSVYIFKRLNVVDMESVNPDWLPYFHASNGVSSVENNWNFNMLNRIVCVIACLCPAGGHDVL